MNMNMMESLGLDQVEEDPNFLPDGKYRGIVSKSDYVLVKSKNTVNHIIEFKVDDPGSKYNGRKRVEFYPMKKDATQDENGNWTGGVVAMDEERKSYYKRRLKSLGVPES